MNNISILVIEDDKNLIEQLVEYLELFFNTIYLAKDGKKGYEYYKKYAPDIILTDINMPEIDGLSLIKKIRKEDEETEIIILSAHTNIEYFTEAVKLKLVSYLIKPIETVKLRETIIEAINKIKQKVRITFPDGYTWDTEYDLLFHDSEKVNLTNYETLFLKTIIKQKNVCVTYADLHYYVYENEEFSQDAISSLVKRLRKKLPRDLIKSCYKEGYKIEL